MHRRNRNFNREYRKEAANLVRPLLGVKIEEKVGENNDEEPRFTTTEHGNMVKRRNSDGTITNNFVFSESMNRFLAPERPYGHKPELWTGHDVWTYYRKNNYLIHSAGILMASVTALVAYGIEYFLQVQVDFYTKEVWARFHDTGFQHIPELKYMYIGIGPPLEGRKFSNDVGYNPGWWPAIMMIATDIVGIIEVILAKRGYSFFTLNRILWTMALITIILGIPVYLNNFPAVIHQGWTIYAWGFGTEWDWWGAAPLRNRTGYCDMVDNPYTGRVSVKYVLRPEMRRCRDLTCFHIIQMGYCFYTGVISYTIMKMVRVPAWGDWSKKKLIAHGRGEWVYTGP